ncbi:MAG: Activator of Hsp90 ATPase 1 family protein [Lacunisphaera sp.]|nr:Activator of Hsp90 ATPase 1 family protein [Lacunisphaera sp.]
MTAKSDTLPPPSPREIINTRLLAAPRERVFAAFSDPAQLAQWWGPKGFTATVHEFDFRPGGQWRVTLHGPDGTDYPNDKEFLEISPPERIVFLHRQTGHDFRMTMTFTRCEGATLVIWVLQFESAAALAPLRDIIAQANEQNFDRLAAHLQKIQKPKP